LLGDTPLIDLVMAPTRIYVKPVLAALTQHEGAIHGLAHITGGGLLENIPRILPPDMSVVLQRDAWALPLLFSWLQQQGNVVDTEMHRVFNCGIGMVVVASADQADAVAATLSAQGETVFRMGEVVAQPQPDAARVVVR